MFHLGFASCTSTTEFGIDVSSPGAVIRHVYVNTDYISALAPADLLSTVITPLSSLLGGLDRLAIKNGGTGASFTSLAETDGFAQRSMHRLPHACQPPRAKVRPHGGPAGKVMG